MKATKKNLKDFVKVILGIQDDLKKSNVLFSENLLDKVIDCYLSALKESSTNNSIFKFPTWQNDETFEDDQIVWFFTEEMIQSEAEMELDRRLTDVELHRVFQCFFEDDDTLWNRVTFTREAIRNAVDEPEQWSDLDKDFLKKKIGEIEVKANDKSRKLCN